MSEPVACNQCGGTCGIRIDPDHPDDWDNYGLIRAVVTGGFESRALEDLTAYRFSICEPCLRHLFDGFAIPPQTCEFGPADPVLDFGDDEERCVPVPDVGGR